MAKVSGCCLILAALAMGGTGGVAQSPAQSTPQPVAPNPAQQLIVLQADQPTAEQVGDALMSHQRYQAAIAAYQKAEPRTAGVLNKIGIAYQMMFDSADAIRYYKASLKLDGKNARVYSNLGTAYDAEKNFGSAEKSYRRAIKLNPQFALAYKNLGSCLMTQHNYRAGAAAYHKALELDPQIFENQGSLRVHGQATAHDRGAMNYYMARSCARSGQVDCALNYLQLAVNQGYATAKRLAEDEEFAALRTLPAFQQLLSQER